MQAKLLRPVALGFLFLVVQSWGQTSLAAGTPPLWRQVDRITWGVTPAELQRAQRQGWQAYLDRQLHPDPDASLPPEVQARIDALSIPQVGAAEALRSQTERRREIRELPQAERAEANQAVRKVSAQRANEASQRMAWRALYSPNQLQEVMTWFWMNHFSVYVGKGDVGALLGDYEDRTIRPHALGKFRDLLRATARAPAMLQFLDNARNVKGRINENYARELMELHTLGVDAGYTQQDVQELARVLTGLGVDHGEKPGGRQAGGTRPQATQDGLFRFSAGRHDGGAKTLLGHTIPPGGMDEIDGVLDLLARQPATAHFISGKLARYFVSDKPGQALVERMAQTFLKSDGDIAQVLRTMFDSPEFAASLTAGKFKDPTQYVYSSLRAAYAEQPPIINVRPAVGMIDRLGQAVGRRITPDGYPLGQSDWSGSGQMTMRFEVARQIATGGAGLYRETPDAAPPKPPVLPSLLDAYGADGPYAGLSSATRTAIEQAPNVREANTLLLSSPEFMRR